MQSIIDTANNPDFLSTFIASAKDDPGKDNAHISFYVSLVGKWYAPGKENPLCVLAGIQCRFAKYPLLPLIIEKMDEGSF